MIGNLQQKAGISRIALTLISPVSIALGIVISPNVASAALIATDSFNTTGARSYSLGALAGQNPDASLLQVDRSFTNAWTSTSGTPDYAIELGGLSKAANGTVGAIGDYAGNNGRITESLTSGAAVRRTFNPLKQMGDETSLWIRFLYQVNTESSSGGNVSFLGTGNTSSVTIGGNSSSYGLSGSGFSNVSGGPTSLIAGATNLILLKLDISRPGLDNAKLWINPNSYANLQAGTNATQSGTLNLLATSQNDIFQEIASIQLSWNNPDAEFDEFAFGTELNDVVAVTGPGNGGGNGTPVPLTLGQSAAASMFIAFCGFRWWKHKRNKERIEAALADLS